MDDEKLNQIIDEARDKFGEVVLDELKTDTSTYRANIIIDAFDDAVEMILDGIL